MFYSIKYKPPIQLLLVKIEFMNMKLFHTTSDTKYHKRCSTT